MDQIRTKELLNEMNRIINQQQQVTDQLLVLATPKQRAIIADDIAALQQIVGQEENLLARLAELEEMRKEVAAGLGKAADHKDQIVDKNFILTIASELDNTLADELTATIKSYTSTYQDLAEANQHSAVLVNDALQHIETVIKVISGSNEGVTYSSQGEMGEVNMRRYLNKRV